MGVKGKMDKGKKTAQRKPLLSLKEKRKQKSEKRKENSAMHAAMEK